MDLVRLLQLDDYPEKWRDVKNALRHGYSPNEMSPSAEGVCAMHLAAGIGGEAVSLMLKYGGQPNVELVDGTTPLHIAASWGCKSAVIVLLQHGADKKLKDDSGKFPYDLALEGGYRDCALLLVPHCNASSSPLHCKQELNLNGNSRCPRSPDKWAQSPETITQRLYKYQKQGTPVCCDVTSPDTPRLHPKWSCPSHQGSCSSYLTNMDTIDACSSETQHHHYIPNCCHSFYNVSRCHNVCGSHHQHNLNSCSAPLCTPKAHLQLHSCQKSPISCVHDCSTYLSQPCSYSQCLTHNSLCKKECMGSQHNKRCENPEAKENHGLHPVEKPYYFDSHPSFQVSKYTASLASSTASPSDKVAAFVLSSADFMSQCTMKDNENSSSKIYDNGNDKSVVNDSESESNKTVSDSSANTFETCSESPCVQDLVKEKERELQLPKLSLNYSTNKETDEEGKYLKPKKPQSGWKPSTLPIATDNCDIMTSDESFLSHRSPRVYRMKTRTLENNKGANLLNSEDKIETIRDYMPSPNTKSMIQKAKPFMNAIILPPDDSLLSTITASADDEIRTIRDTMPPPNLRLIPRAKPFMNELVVPSDDSLLSSVTAKEVVVKDKESGIVLIERHTPSVSGSSVGRRSLDSISSRATVDSQATFIYDWHTLGQISKQVKAKPTEGPSIFRQSNNDGNEFCNRKEKDLSSQSSSGFSSDTKTLSLESQDDLPDSDVPDHLATLSCEEISQELKKYGELTGPVVASTRQVYLKRLASLEANPGLITLCSKVPDFPVELRQALEGQFDASHLPMLEAKMVEEFTSASSVNKQWREGTSKSSFTYLLLDPRVTENLPLRAKDMTDLEVFKTFVCSIFYVGKGKRARPYCHLHEAVRQMNKNTTNNASKMSKKVKQVIEIWQAGLGVVSLHCFQSVIPVEAYTREACMIEAIGIHKLTNIKRGDFYGVSSTWSMQLRRQVGVYLLQKALQIFLADGERQICLPDLST